MHASHAPNVHDARILAIATIPASRQGFFPSALFFLLSAFFLLTGLLSAFFFADRIAVSISVSIFGTTEYLVLKYSVLLQTCHIHRELVVIKLLPLGSSPMSYACLRVCTNGSILGLCRKTCQHFCQHFCCQHFFC